MHHHRSPGGSTGGEPHDHCAQRLLLLELVSDPPPEGDRLARLAAVLDMELRRLELAASALAAVGLATRDGEVVHASAAALRFEALWPISL